MSENLFLRLVGERVEWLLLDDVSGVVRVRGNGSLDEFEEMIARVSWSGGVYAMLAGEEVLLTGAAIPSKQKRQILQAVPYVVEESLAADVEDCHFAIGDRRDDGEISVAVVERDQFKTRLDRLAAMGVQPSVVAVDTLMIPFESGTTAIIDGDRVLVRTGKLAGFCIEKSLFATAISLLQTGQRESLRVLVHPDEMEEAQLQLSQIQAESDLAPVVEELEYAAFETLCRNYDRRTLNLLQGEFRVEEERRDVSHVWRSAAILAGCAFLLHLVLVTAQGAYLDVKGRQYETEARELYNEVFPNDRNVRDMRRRWQAHLSGRAAGGDADFLDLFKQTAKNIPGTNLVLNNVNYNESRGDMILQLEAPNSDQLVAFSQTLSKLGLDADVGTISQDADLVNGSIKIRIAGDSS